MRRYRILLALFYACSALTSCGSDSATAGRGDLEVRLAAEDVITDGLEAGDGPEDIQDGWSARFERYIVAIGDVDVHASTNDSLSAQDESVHVIDLTELPPSGAALWSLEGLTEGRWEFGYSSAQASASATRHDSVSQEDYDQMSAEGWTYLIDGVLSNTSGQSCPPSALVEPGDKSPNGANAGGDQCYDAPEVRFTFGAPAVTRFGPCEIDGVPGVAISANDTQSASITIHGDHLFFNGFPEGAEGGVSRLAQWLADCDLNLDGVVTQAELESITPAQLPEIDERFQLGGAPIDPVNMYAYLQAQLKTQGHFQGEGECPVDGVEHEHDDHDHDDHDTEG